LIRFLLYYGFIIIARTIRLIVQFLFLFFKRKHSHSYFISEMDGDKNYLSSPLRTIRSIFLDDLVKNCNTVVDIGGGEGLPSVFLRLFYKKRVFMHERQWYLAQMVRWMCYILMIFRLRVSRSLCKKYPSNSVFLCVWTSWSHANRRSVIESLIKVFPSGSYLITVSHGVNHPLFKLMKEKKYLFAWGEATVYYYKHA